MNRERIYITLVGLIFVGLIAYLYINQQERFDWQERYQQDSKEPYGLTVIHQLLDSYTEADELRPLEDSINGQLPAYEDANYFFVGAGMYMTERDLDELLAFVETGNVAFISTKVLPFDLMFHLYYDECIDEPWNGYAYSLDTVLNCQSLPDLEQKEDYDFVYKSDHNTQSTTWHYFYDGYFCEEFDDLEPIGYWSSGEVNFVRVDYGDGYFYLHSNPQVFTNLFLLTEDGKAYTEQLLGGLNDGPIYWDEYSRVPESIAARRNDQYREQPRRLSSQNPLQYILDQPPLAWAWYVLIAIGLLFLLFRTKRSQRVIPVVRPPKNSSLAFVKNIGWLYYDQGSHQKIAIQASQSLRQHVRERYGLQWKANDRAFEEQLSRRSGLPLNFIERLAKDTRNIPTYTGLLEAELIRFHQQLEEFYKKAK